METPLLFVLRSSLNGNGRHNKDNQIRLAYNRAHSKHNTIRAYKFTITRFNQKFADLNLKEVSIDKQSRKERFRNSER